MPSISITGRDLPLPARIFYTAMERQLSLAEYAKSLGLGSDSLRAILTAQLGDLEPDTLDRVAELYQQPRETLPEQLQSAAPQETFADWLKRNMEGVTQHALRTRVQVDGKTIRRFLSAEELPDSDLAERISRALYIDRAELARVVTANMAFLAGAQRRAAEAAAARPQRTRQRAPAAPVASASPAQPPVAPRAAPVLEAISVLNRVANGAARQAPAGGEAARPEQPRREGAKKPAQAALEVPAAAAAKPTEAAPIAAKPAEARPARAVAMEASGAKPAEARPARTAAAKGAGTRPGETGAPAQPDRQGAPEAAAPPAPAAELEQAPPRKQRRARNASITIPGDIVATPVEAAATPGKDASVPVAAPPASEAAVVVQPAAPEPAPAPAEVASAAPEPAPEPAPVPRARQRRAPEAAQRGEALAATAVVAPDTATLQLSADEVRLIRHWRQLHPHGRRATLHYIGSLLVDE